MMNPKTLKLTSGDVKSWQFPLKGGPHNKKKYRLHEPLPTRLDIEGSVYFLTSLPERKLWPLMYVYDEVRSLDSHSTGSSRAARTQLIAKAALFGASHWYRWGRQRA